MLVLVLAGAGQAQSLLQTFGSGANQFAMEFVMIGNPNNAADTTGNPNPVGSVSYMYNLGKYEVSRDMITKANTAGSLGISLQDMSPWGAMYNGMDRPATGITWYEAAKYVNWLNTSTGGTAAYKFDGSGSFQLWSVGDAGYNANNLFRNSLAKYVIASRDEWYKGAYGSPSGTWYDYATGSDLKPTAVASGTAANTAVYNGQSGPADITSAGGLSAYGTMGQTGNVYEWNETAYDGINNTAGENRDLVGGVWVQSVNLDSSFRTGTIVWADGYTYGFRVAMVPEPSALSLFAVGLGGLALLRQSRKKD